MYDPILVPVDGSDAATRAADEAFQFARANGGSIHLLFVLDESATALLLSPESMSGRFDRLRGKATELLDEYVARADGLPVETAVVRGMGVHRGIVDYAEQAGIELVVMGSRGPHGPAGVLGSTTQRVAAHTDLPVMVLTPDQDDESGDAPDQDEPES